MKTTHKMMTQTLVLGLMLLGLAACGNRNNTNGQMGVNQYGQTVDQFGNVVGQNGGVIPNGAGGCVPLQGGAIQFQAQGARVSSTDVLMGMLPAQSRVPGQHGQVVLGAGQFGGQQFMGGGGMTLSKQSQNGALQMSIGQGGMVTGMLQLGQNVLSAMSGMFGGQVACASSIAVDAVYTGYYGQGYINQALVYIVVNGQTIGPIPL